MVGKPILQVFYKEFQECAAEEEKAVSGLVDSQGPLEETNYFAE